MSICCGSGSPSRPTCKRAIRASESRVSPHDFGSYSEAVVYYDNKDDKSVGFAFFVEENLPENWNDADVFHYVHQEQRAEA